MLYLFIFYIFVLLEYPCHRKKVVQKECKGREMAWQTFRKGRRIPEISNVFLTGSLVLWRILSGIWKVPEGLEKEVSISEERVDKEHTTENIEDEVLAER